MPQMKRGGFMGAVKRGKAGTKVRKSMSQPGAFKPKNQGIVAHGMAGRVESPTEAKDRRLG